MWLEKNDFYFILRKKKTELAGGLLGYKFEKITEMKINYDLRKLST